ncbi:hypothetical protein DFS34DRAFT_167505 [Phlyctochytrium arcticum]|nr:hypothetical protein DFS34DRAFT_167505 [Phlyctochytrium arcticum]
MAAFTRSSLLVLFLSLLLSWTTDAIPAVKDIARENGIPTCGSTRALTILPTDDNDGQTLGQLAVIHDNVTGRQYSFNLTFVLPEASTVTSTGGLVQLVTGLGKNKAVGFTAEAKSTDNDPAATISQFFLIQMI